jgi:nitrite reductase/ring-hydroxylating ferredoxin subunit
MMPQQLVAVGRADALAAAAARHHLTLRHSSNVYQTMLLFSLAPPPGASEDERRWYAMQATCPHLEAPLEHATLETVESELEAEAQRDITDVEDTVVVCPHHEWSWSLRTGESDHSPAGMRACTFAVSVQDGMLSVEAPQLEQNAPGSWLLVESRPVSERFYEPKPAADAGPSSSQVQLVAPDPVPQSLTAWASLVLNTANPRLKVHYTRLAAAAWRDARCTRVGGGRWNFDDSEAPEWRRKPEETPPGIPPRDQLNVVRPGHEAKRGKGGTERGRIALLRECFIAARAVCEVLTRAQTRWLQSSRLPSTWRGTSSAVAQSFSRACTRRAIRRRSFRTRSTPTFCAWL